MGAFLIYHKVLRKKELQSCIDQPDGDNTHARRTAINIKSMSFALRILSKPNFPIETAQVF
ncbi:hypothetical protein XhhCFBP4925_05400 [Xanthomonas hortorum pv. hederae]|nr:hypothetical protein XhhCFBP4925_05400 [Xanthomonas hortorum pv. hederae]PUE91235.1 hypothetical protein C7T87_24225 [Xanthomonas hortorum pv. hederae]